MTQFEIIDVVGRDSLIDGAGNTRRYATADGRPLLGGYYVLFDAAPDGDLYFDETTRYNGPYPAELSSRDHLEQQVRSRLRQAPRPRAVPPAPAIVRFAVDWQV